jgi:hypothetical protein
LGNAGIEAGGSLARYIDPDNAVEAYLVIRQTIEDRAGLMEWRERVQREFTPVAWSDAADALIEILDRRDRTRAVRAVF